jgi:2-polyprenyl-3-methyl-5-hydroxy-6-metoxy-1,4-benzoquinol methylase
MRRTISTDTILECNSCGRQRAEVVSKSRDFEYDSCDNEFTFVRCAHCQLVYLRDRPAVSALDIIYPPNYIPYEFNEHLGPLLAKARNIVQARKIRPIKALAPGEALIVDVGCGSGEFLRLLKKFGCPAWRLAGVDISDRAIANLAGMGIEGRRGRFEAMEWDLPAPDVIIMNQVIEHLDNPAAVVRRSFDLLKPGGLLVLETPSVDAWDAEWFRRRYWGGWHTPRHWTLYTPKTLGALLESAGFEIAEVKHILSPNFWLQSIHHWMSERGSMMRQMAPFLDVKHLIPLCAATAFDLFQLTFRGTTSNFRMIGKKPV